MLNIMANAYPTKTIDKRSAGIPLFNLEIIFGVYFKLVLIQNDA